MNSSDRPRVFGILSDGREVTEYTLANTAGMVVKILDYGGIIRAMVVPDKRGQLDDIVLGFDNLQQYEGVHPYFGAIIGRVAGRLSGGHLQIDGVDHQLPVNDPPNHLHGGATGFDHRLWRADYSAENQSLKLSYESPDGEEGYPGKLISSVTYKLTDDNELIVGYHATTDVPTVVNLTQHSYFNLSGDPSESVLNHTLVVNSDQVLELDDSAIPTGRMLDVANSRFDFRESRRIGEEDSDGFDDYWVLSERTEDEAMKFAVELGDEESGRVIRVFTTAPGVQIYTGNALPNGLVGKQQIPIGLMSGFCVETQVHPDSPNHPNFPGILLDSSTVFESTTAFHFLVRGR